MTFRDILNETLLGGERLQLLERMSRNPERFVGLFRPSVSKHKLLQNILQNREIRFGDAMERVVRTWLGDHGYKMQESQITPELWCDLYFLAPERKPAYLVEMKMRDDHDSTKRQGQWDNFDSKVRILHERHGRDLIAVFYFLDPSFSKNRDYYQVKCDALTKDLALPTIFLWYGSQLFERLTEAEDWERFQNFLYQWKQELTETEMLNMETPEGLRELSSLDIRLWRRIIDTAAFWDESFIRTLFPTGNGLRQIASQIERYNPSLADALRRRITNLFGTPY